ncbi:TPA: RraA family protein [Salmonella enterica]|nr:RraA family protein [Salmonella enterica]
MSNGFRVYMQRVLPNPELITAFKAIPAANIADCMGRLSAMNSTIRLQSAPLKNNMVGVALTVKVRAGDNLMVHKALNMLMPDDVLVVSNDGGNSQALMGEIMITYAQQRQVSGIVLDGPVRDLYSIQGMDFPVYATGSTPAGPYKDGPGEVNVPISCGGMQVNPGDIIVGDGDGVIVIPRQDAEALLSEAQKYQLFDNKKLLATQSGNVDRSWVDKELANKNCEVINDIWR